MGAKVVGIMRSDHLHLVYAHVVHACRTTHQQTQGDYGGPRRYPQARKHDAIKLGCLLAGSSLRRSEPERGDGQCRGQPRIRDTRFTDRARKNLQAVTSWPDPGGGQQRDSCLRRLTLPLRVIRRLCHDETLEKNSSSSPEDQTVQRQTQWHFGHA